LEIATLLLQHKANMDLLDGEGSTPLYWAVTARRRPLVELLLTHKSKVDVGTEGMTPFQLAINGGQFEIAEMLLNAGG